MQPYIINIVLQYKLLGDIDGSNLEKSTKFSGYLYKEGKKTARIYLNGFCIVTGVTSVSKSDEFIRKGFPYNPIITREVKNMTALGKIPFGISSFKLLEWHQKNIDKSPFEYESEIYPAVYWKGEPETVYFFMSGKVIITGLKSLSRLDPVWDHFLQDIDEVMKLPGLS